MYICTKCENKSRFKLEKIVQVDYYLNLETSVIHENPSTGKIVNVVCKECNASMKDGEVIEK